MTTTLLIIDESQINRRKYCSYLNSDRLCNYLVLEVENIEQAKEVCEHKKPDVILLDFLLFDQSNQNGLEFLNWIKQQRQLALIPILLLAYQKDEIIVSQLAQSGIQDYLIKEYLTPLRLERSLDNLLEKTQLLNNMTDVVSLRKRADEIRMAKEEKFLCLVQCSDDVIWSSNLEGQFIYLSPQFKELFGWEPSEWIGKSLIELVHSGDCHRVRANFEQVLNFNHKSDMPVEFRHLQIDGSYVWVSTNMVAMRNAHGEAISIQGISRDISDRISLAYAIRERKLAEGRLRDSNQILAAFNQELMASAQQKKEFLTHISHDLRTVLNTILGSLECLQDGIYGDLNVSQRKVLQTVEINENHLLALINKIIEFSKSDGKI